MQTLAAPFPFSFRLAKSSGGLGLELLGQPCLSHPEVKAAKGSCHLKKSLAQGGGRPPGRERGAGVDTEASLCLVSTQL